MFYIKIHFRNKEGEWQWVRDVNPTNPSEHTLTSHESEACLLRANDPLQQALIYSLLQKECDVELHKFKIEKVEIRKLF